MLPAIVAVAAGLVVFYTVVKYGFRTMSHVQYHDQWKANHELERKRWGGQDGSS